MISLRRVHSFEALYMKGMLIPYGNPAGQKVILAARTHTQVKDAKLLHFPDRRREGEIKGTTGKHPMLDVWPKIESCVFPPG